MNKVCKEIISANLTSLIFLIFAVLDFVYFNQNYVAMCLGIAISGNITGIRLILRENKRRLMESTDSDAERNL